MKTFNEMKQSQQPKKTLSKERRELMLMIIDDFPPCIAIMHQLDHYRHCDRFLKWLLWNKIKGKDLFEWIKTIFNY